MEALSWTRWYPGDVHQLTVDKAGARCSCGERYDTTENGWAQRWKDHVSE